jgi:hypothetical protein
VLGLSASDSLVTPSLPISLSVLSENENEANGYVTGEIKRSKR